MQTKGKREREKKKRRGIYEIEGEGESERKGERSKTILRVSAGSRGISAKH